MSKLESQLFDEMFDSEDDGLDQDAIADEMVNHRDLRALCELVIKGAVSEREVYSMLENIFIDAKDYIKRVNCE